MKESVCYYDELFNITLINILNNWDMVQQNKTVINTLKNNPMYTKLAESEIMECDQLTQAHILTYYMLCIHILSIPNILECSK